MNELQSLEESSDFRLEVGFRFPEKSVVVDREEQTRLHKWCDIEPTVFGDVADPALVTRLPVVMVANTVVAQRPEWGQVHTTHRMLQRRPILIGESLTLTGVIDGFVAHPRGEIMQCSWFYQDANGEIALEVYPEALLIDPAIDPRRSAANERVKPPAEQTKYLFTKRCTPQATAGYCEGTNNLIHLDLAAAQRFGFRAPIIAGTQTMSFLLEAIYRAYSPHALALTIGFRRPVFWDDELAIVVTERDAGSQYIQALNKAQKCVADCLVEAALEE
ncbi:MAG: MaoC/PaaZ C-terminal domain-containing protein [Proteobacteria bacterium]|nr:MaoC/PaaZ C-terminal domain-containing protein [Pseudomonadota bacterium]